jgi:hypothetical protein
MELGPKFQRNLAIVGTILGAYTLSGCSDPEYIDISPTPAFELNGEGVLKIPGQHKSYGTEFSCDGSELVAKHATMDGPDEKRYINDPACVDGKIDSDDF